MASMPLDVRCMNTKIYVELINALPKALYLKGENLRKEISLQWVCHLLEYNQLDQATPPIWVGQDWHQRRIPVVIKALLPPPDLDLPMAHAKMASLFLSRPRKEQMLIVARADVLFGELVMVLKDKVLKIELRKLPQEIYATLREYIMKIDHLLDLSEDACDRQIEAEASAVAEILFPYLRDLPLPLDKLPESDSKENI